MSSFSNEKILSVLIYNYIRRPVPPGMNANFPAETFYNSFGKSWMRLVGATYNPFGDARATWNGAYQRVVDFSLRLVLSAYSMTVAVGHFSLSSSDTTADCGIFFTLARYL